MKDEKTLVFLTALSLIFTLFISYSLSAGPASTKYGDLNADGKINSTDYNLGKRLILRTISELPISNGSVALTLTVIQRLIQRTLLR